MFGRGFKITSQSLARSRYRVGVSILLLACLASNGLGLVGFGHAHSHHPQDHSDSQHAHAPHCHADGSHHHSHHHGEPLHTHSAPAKVNPAAAWHIHVCWFGFDLQMPWNEETSDPDDPQNPFALIQILDDAISSRGITNSLELMTDLPQPRTTHDEVAAKVTLLLRSAPVSSLPLCDSARLNRTGVRLI